MKLNKRSISLYKTKGHNSIVNIDFLEGKGVEYHLLTDVSNTETPLQEWVLNWINKGLLP